MTAQRCFWVWCIVLWCGCDGRQPRTEDPVYSARDAGVAADAGCIAPSSSCLHGGKDGGARADGGAAPLPPPPNPPTLPACTAEDLPEACMARSCGRAVGCDGWCGGCASDEACQAGECLPRECVTLTFQFTTRATCAIAIEADEDVYGDGFIHLEGEDHRVLAMATLGTGRMLAWCDTSTIAELLEVEGLRSHLSRRPNPRVATFGHQLLCGQRPTSIAYLGAGLPDRYLDDPALLAEDWDLLVYCGHDADWDDAWTPLFHTYVEEYGRGFVGALDYAGWDVRPEHFQQMNQIFEPTGIRFLEEDHRTHAPIDAQLVLPCADNPDEPDEPDDPIVGPH